jgi:hypothetical protein
VEDHVLAEGETDGGAHEGYAEIGHFCGHFDCKIERIRICDVVCVVCVDSRVDEQLRFCRLKNGFSLK